MPECSGDRGQGQSHSQGGCRRMKSREAHDIWSSRVSQARGFSRPCCHSYPSLDPRLMVHQHEEPLLAAGLTFLLLVKNPTREIP